MSSSAYTTQMRALMCPTCGAPVTTPSQGGQYQCGYCRAVGTLGARMDARPPVAQPSAQQEEARLAKLRFQYDQGQTASPYSTFVAPTDVIHLVQLRPPESFGPWMEAWRYAVGLLAQDPSEHNQKRVFWLANLTGAGVLNLGKNDPPRARAIRETALELLPDPGHKHILRCGLSRAACSLQDLQSAQDWLAGCDPYPGNITLDSEYRLSSAMLHHAYGQWSQVVGVLGNQPGVIPFDYGRHFLAGVYRVHACEELGWTQAADAQLGHWFQEEKKMDGAVIMSIIASGAPMGLCRKTCARLGIPIPS